MDYIEDHQGVPYNVESLHYCVVSWSHKKQAHEKKLLTARAAYQKHRMLVRLYNENQVIFVANHICHAVLQAIENNWCFRRLRLGTSELTNVQTTVTDIIHDVATSHARHTLFYECPPVFIRGVQQVLVNQHGQVAMPTLASNNGGACHQRALELEHVSRVRHQLIWTTVECTEHLQTVMQQRQRDWSLMRINPSCRVGGSVGELIVLDTGHMFENPANRHYSMKACRHCKAPLFKGEDSFCCNKGREILHDGHFEFWEKQYTPNSCSSVEKQFFEACNSKTLRNNPRLVNNTLAFAMMKHDSIHGTGRTLRPDYHPWMVSIQGRTYHTMLNSAQPHSTLNNNISW
jgi:hypothetical protein